MRRHQWAVGGLSLGLLILSSTRATADFRNQFTTYALSKLGTTAEYVQFVKEWGYEWVVGDPWNGSKAEAAVNGGLGVMFNTNGANGAGKWAQFENPAGGTAEAPINPTKVNIGNGVWQPVTPALMAIFDKTFCMNPAGLNYGPTEIYRPTGGGTVFSRWRWQPYQVRSSIVFRANHRSQEGIDETVAAWMRLRKAHEDAAGKRLYTAIYFDEMTYPGNNANMQCANPINDDHPGTNPASYDAGRKIFFNQMQATFKAAVGAANYKGTTGNVWAPHLYQVQNEPGMFLDLTYLESSGGLQCDTLAELEAGPATGCGSQNAANFGVLNKANVQVNPHAIFHNNCRGAQLTLGRAAAQTGTGGKGIWGSWFGATHVQDGNKCVYLLRAIPNWDNMVDAGSRSWNEVSDTYSSTNSFINNNVVYSRHRLFNTNHRLYVVKRAAGTPITLKTDEKVVNAVCTTTRFYPDVPCVTGYFTQSGTTVNFGASVQNDNGYILTVHRQPRFQSAAVTVADQLDVCWTTDDAPANMLPASAATGFTVQVAGVTKVPTSITRIGSSCYRFVFAGSTITTGSQQVTVAYSAGNVTAGTAMINAAGNVPAATITTQTATNTLGGGGGGPIPVTTQTKYQWGHINGPVDTASLYFNLNSQLLASPGALARLYIKYRNITAERAATRFPLYYAINPANEADPSLGTPLTDVCTPTTVCYTLAQGVDDTGLTIERLASDENIDVRCSIIQSETSVPICTLPAGSETECVYTIKFGESMPAGQRVFFYPRAEGAALLDGYTTSNLPHATIFPDRQDLLNMSTMGGSVQ